MKGVTFGLDDVYDDKAESTYSTGNSYAQKNNNGGGQRNNYKNNGPKKPDPPAPKPKPEKKADKKPTKLLGGWEDQGALRIAWDDLEEK